MRNTYLKAVGVGWAVAALTAYVALAQPAGVLNQDVGSPALFGSYTVGQPAAGQYTIVGGGNDIWNTSDNFHFAYIPVTGNFDHIVRVRDLQGPDNWSKAELMAREPDVSNLPQGGDRFVANMTTRAGGQNEVALQWRSDMGTAVSGGGSGCAWPNDIGITVPLQRPSYPDTWLRLERFGNEFFGYFSTDGVTWTLLRGSPYIIDATTLNGSETTPRTDGPMANALLVGLAVTAHNDGDLTGGVAVFSDWRPWTPVPISITTQPPPTVNSPANNTLTITAAATGDPVHYQWFKGADPVPGARGATLTIPLAQPSDSGSYTVRCYGAGQTAVTSSACVVTITQDTTPPTVVEAMGSATFTEASIKFSEPVVAPSATTAGNYTIAGLTVSAATLSADGFSVFLTTSRQAEGQDYTITINNVQDSGGNPVPANTTVAFKSFSFLAGQAMMEQWNYPGSPNIDTLVDEKIGYAAPPTAPTRADTVTFVSSFETPSWENGGNYGGSLSGWFIAPATGSYIFYSCSDDQSYLFLSSDDTPANKRKISREATWDNQRSWRGATRRDASDNGRDPNADGSFINQSDTWLDNEWGGTIGVPNGVGATINLVQGRRYFIQGVWNEGGGGDGFGATYRLSSEAEPADNTPTLITGALIGTYADTSKLPPVVSSPAANSAVTVASGATLTLSVVANNPAAGSLNYQWSKNGYDITGATGADYVVASASVANCGQYTCRVSNQNGSVTSKLINVLVEAPAGAVVFNIEAEDYDHGGGQTVAAASQMPYLGGAYMGLVGTVGVDFQNGEDTGGGITDYRGGTFGGPAVACSVEMGGNQWATTRMGAFVMTANYKIGWIGSGDWGNYTRTFSTPAKTYHVIAAQSYDGTAADQLNSRLGKVTAGVGTATQTVEPIGVFRSNGSAGWSRNNLVVMTDAPGGAPKTVELGGTVTLRWNYDSGDAEYLVFIPASEVAPTISASTNPQGQPVITYTGVLYGSATVDGTYTPVAGATSPFTVTGGAGAAGFYRAGSQ
jgi:hypothetical protein